MDKSVELAARRRRNHLGLAEPGRDAPARALLESRLARSGATDARVFLLPLQPAGRLPRGWQLPPLVLARAGVRDYAQFLTPNSKASDFPSRKWRPRFVEADWQRLSAPRGENG